MVQIQPTADDTANWLDVLGNLPAGGADVPVTSGAYTLRGNFTVPKKTRLRLEAGVHLRIATVGGDVFSLDHAASIEGAESSSSDMQVLGTANFNRLVTNVHQDGSQEYAYLRGLGVWVAAGAQIAGPVVDFVSVFVDSAIQRVVVNCNRMAGPGIRVTGSATAGFGPVVVEKAWVLNSKADSVVVTENNPSKGACQFWGRDITVEHQASGFHGLHLVGYGALEAIDVQGLHYENGYPATAPTAAVCIDGVHEVRIGGAELLAANLANKVGYWITKKANNLHLKIDRPANPNGINPVLQNDLTGERLSMIPTTGYTVS